jgi:2-polyprenyl-3-methyl-5-hydroxy-6-metoxy-1,4-benzoquinol methylase
VTVEGPAPVAHHLGVAKRALDDELQRLHFEDRRHRYQPARILRPPRHTVREIQRIVAGLTEVPLGATICDFGCGTGRLSIPLAQAGYAVVAVDISESSLGELLRTARGLAIDSIVTATALPSKPCLAAVVGSDVLHHVDLDRYLPRIQRALRPGGRVVFSEPGGLNPAWYLYLAARRELRVERRIVLSTPRRLRAALLRHGFVDVRITGVGLLPLPLAGFSDRACRWNERLGDLPFLRSFAYRYLVEASAG